MRRPGLSAGVTAAAPAGPVQLTLQLDGFEGPLDLLLSLIEGHRLPITQVSLAQVADQYLQQIRALPYLDPDLLADFLAIGGKLLLLKSRALLLTEQPDPVVEETASELEQRLAEYQLVRAAAERLQELELADRRAFLATREPARLAALPPLAPTTPEQLLAAWKRLLLKPAPVQGDLVLVPRASIEACRSVILDLLRTHPTVAFSAIAGASVDQVIATFLAVLELFRRGLLLVEQPDPFADLTLRGAPATASASA